MTGQYLANARLCRLLSQDLHTDVDVSSTLTVQQETTGVPLMLCTNSLSHLSSSRSCPTVLHLVSSEAFPTYAWPSNYLHPWNLATKSPWRAGASAANRTFSPSSHWRRSFAVGTHHVLVLKLCNMLNDPRYQRKRLADRSPQIRLRAALQSSDEALHQRGGCSASLPLQDARGW